MSDTGTEQARAAQRIANAYRRVFSSADGATVLADLEKSFGLNMPAFIPQMRGRGAEYDATHAAIRDGQRQIVLHIQAKLAAPAKGDAEIEQPKARVKK